MFNQKAQETILTFNLNHPTDNLSNAVFKGDFPLKDNVEQLIVRNCKASYHSNLALNSPDRYDLFWNGLYLAEKGNYADAISFFTRSSETGLRPVNATYEITDCIAKLGGTSRRDLLDELSLFEKYTKQGSQTPFLKRLVRKIIRILKKT